MNNKQKFQLILAGIAAALIVFWLVYPGNAVGRFMGILSNALLILAMLLSYRAEEKLKKNGDKTE